MLLNKKVVAEPRRQTLLTWHKLFPTKRSRIRSF